MTTNSIGATIQFLNKEIGMEGMLENLGVEELEYCDSNILTVFNSITEELERAVSKFPEFPTDPLHALAILGEEYGELNKAVLQFTYEPHKTSREEIRMEAVQTATMAVRFLLSLDKYQYAESSQHNQEI